MEENEQEQQTESMFDISISPSVIHSLRETCRWARIFVYISGSLIILCVLLFLFGWSLVDSAFYRVYGELESIIVGAAVVVAVVYIFFMALLFNFTMKVKKGIDEWNIQKIEQGISSLKLYFLLSGILGALYLVLGAITILKILM